MFYNPWKENIFGGIEKEQNLYEGGYTITKESATCMVIIFQCYFHFQNRTIVIYDNTYFHGNPIPYSTLLDCRTRSNVDHVNNHLHHILCSLPVTYHRFTSYIFKVRENDLKPGLIKSIKYVDIATT